MALLHLLCEAKGALVLLLGLLSCTWEAALRVRGRGADDHSLLSRCRCLLPSARPRANMDVLVSMGTNASYIYSVISILHHHFADHHVSMAYQPTDFFETSAMLITLVLFGKYLESAVSESGRRPLAAVAGAPPCSGILQRLPPAASAAARQLLRKRETDRTCQPYRLPHSLPAHLALRPLPLQAKGKTSEAISLLSQLAPSVATLVEVDEKGAVVGESEVPSALIHRGDLLKVGEARGGGLVRGHPPFEPFTCLILGLELPSP